MATALRRPLAVAGLAPDTLLVAESNGDRIAAVHLPDGKVTAWPIAGLKAPDANTCRTQP